MLCVYFVELEVICLGVKVAREVELYREFVDGLVERREGVMASWVEARGWPTIPENDAVNQLLTGLSSRQRHVLAGMIVQARDSGMHDVLVYLQEQMDLGGLKLVAGGIELPNSPFGSELFGDWTARVDGMEWPTE